MSSMALKLIAIVTMAIDHTGAILAMTHQHFEIASHMRVVGRVASGVKLINMDEGVTVVSMAKITDDDHENENIAEASAE